MEYMKIDMPTEVNQIIDILIGKGYKAYAVGGCIRDSIMKISPNDWDICTSALPDEVLEILGKSNIIENGIKHGTVTVCFGKNFYEITTFRIDGNYADNRHPEKVSFVRNLHEDLSRRDFTVNAMAYNQKDGLQDYFGGKEDIENRIIRCVGNPDSRFEEDTLRILRGLRFASRLGFRIDEKTSDSIHKNSYLLKNISAERICAEFLQIINGDYAKDILIEYSDVFKVIIPEIEPLFGFEQHTPYHVYDVWKHTIEVIKYSEKGKIPRLAAFFHDIGKPECFRLDENGTGHFKGHENVSAKMTEEILKRLKLDNKTIEKVILLIKWHDFRPSPKPKEVRRLISEIGKENFIPLIQLKRADALGQNPEFHERTLAYIDKLTEIFYNETANGEDYTIKSLRINGNDLKELGIKDGKEIGKYLKGLLSAVIDGDVKNEHQDLIIAAENMKGGLK